MTCSNGEAPEAPLTTAGFTTLSQTVTIPAGVARVRVSLTGFAPTDVATRGTVTFDDVGLSPSNRPGLAELLRPGRGPAQPALTISRVLVGYGARRSWTSPSCGRTA